MTVDSCIAIPAFGCANDTSKTSIVRPAKSAVKAVGLTRDAGVRRRTMKSAKGYLPTVPFFFQSGGLPAIVNVVGCRGPREAAWFG
jgi:hypothetical protein